MPDHCTSARESSSTIPSSIARPIANGISAWATIHTTPNTIPRTSVPTWCRPTHTSRRVAERVSGCPGSFTGSRITARS